MGASISHCRKPASLLTQHNCAQGGRFPPTDTGSQSGGAPRRLEVASQRPLHMLLGIIGKIFGNETKAGLFVGVFSF